MTRYTQQPAEQMLLLAWWADIPDEDADVLFRGLGGTPSAFLNAFAPPTRLWYDADAHGIRHAVWVDPMLGGAFVSYWLRPDTRQHKRALRNVVYALAEALREFPVLIGLSATERLASIAERIGFVRLAPAVPWVLHGHDAHVSYITSKELWHRWGALLRDGR